jgi:uncharacterized cofD-like protein
LKVVVIGGGTGSFVILNALKKYTQDIVALVSMADDGGSTGLLRDELGTLPPGDVRQCLVALSDSPELRDLFTYRFDEGTLAGHSLGNLFLTALEKTTGNFGAAVELASKVLNICGSVEPITLDNITLATKFANGRVVKGENLISQTPIGIKKGQVFWLEPAAAANPKALAAIAHADMVIIAPGSVYGSLGPSLMVGGIGRALKDSKALKLHVCNLVTKPGQSDGYTPYDFADELQRLAGERFLDVVLVNTESITPDLVKRYASDGEKPVDVTASAPTGVSYKIIGVPLLGNKKWDIAAQNGDALAHQRSLIRHDGDAVVRAILDVYSNQ